MSNELLSHLFLSAEVYQTSFRQETQLLKIHKNVWYLLLHFVGLWVKLDWNAKHK